MIGWAKLALPLMDRLIILSATSIFEGWDNLSHKFTMDYNRSKIATNYEGSEAEIVLWPDNVPPNNPLLKDHTEEFKRIISEQMVSLQSTGDVFILLPLALKEVLLQDHEWVDGLSRHCGGKPSFAHWGSNIGSNQWQDVTDAIFVSLFHANRRELRKEIVGISGQVPQDCVPFRSKAVAVSAFMCVRP